MHITLKLFVVLLLLTNAACTSIKPPPECSGAIRKVNPPDISVTNVKCESGAV